MTLGPAQNYLDISVQSKLDRFAYLLNSAELQLFLEHGFLFLITLDFLHAS
jgi:hypothetical protein